MNYALFMGIVLIISSVDQLGIVLIVSSVDQLGIVLIASSVDQLGIVLIVSSVDQLGMVLIVSSVDQLPVCFDLLIYHLHYRSSLCSLIKKTRTKEQEEGNNTSIIIMNLETKLSDGFSSLKDEVINLKDEIKRKGNITKLFINENLTH